MVIARGLLQAAVGNAAASPDRQQPPAGLRRSSQPPRRQPPTHARPSSRTSASEPESRCARATVIAVGQALRELPPTPLEQANPQRPLHGLSRTRAVWPAPADARCSTRQLDNRRRHRPSDNFRWRQRVSVRCQGSASDWGNPYGRSRPRAVGRRLKTVGTYATRDRAITPSPERTLVTSNRAL